MLRVICLAACGILTDWRWNLCPLHWQADSYHWITRKAREEIWSPSDFMKRIVTMFTCSILCGVVGLCPEVGEKGHFQHCKSRTEWGKVQEINAAFHWMPPGFQALCKVYTHQLISSSVLICRRSIRGNWGMEHFSSFCDHTANKWLYHFRHKNFPWLGSFQTVPETWE